jgi:hypothetical protein
MSLRLDLNTGNAAFEPDGLEVARLLRYAADRVEAEGLHTSLRVELRDYNGNTVGRLTADAVEVEA